MTTSPTPSTLLVIGSDSMLAYLLTRFAEQSGCQLIQRSYAPWVGELRQLKPAAIIFSSLEQLQASQTLVEELSAHETLVLVCAAVADEFRARELGADACLFHPLTYENFWAALQTVCPPKFN